MNPNDIDYDDMTDDELAALDAGGGEVADEETPPPADDPTPGDGDDPQPADGGDPDPAPAADLSPEPTDTNPAPRAVPLPEHQAMRTRAQTAEEKLAEAAAEAKQAKATAKYWEIKAEEGADAAADFWHQYQAGVKHEQATQQRENQVRTEADQQAVKTSLQAYDRAYTATHGERYAKAIAKVVGVLGEDVVAERARKLTAAGEDPGAWVLDMAERQLAPDPESFKKSVADEVAKQVQAALSKNSPPAPRANPASSVAHVKSNAAPSLEDLDDADPDDLTDAQLAALDARDKERLRKR